MSRTIRLVGHVAHTWTKRNAYRVLVGKLEGKIPLGRHRYKWEDTNKMDSKRKSMGWNLLDFSGSG
jgi:hypothetical protein